MKTLNTLGVVCAAGLAAAAYGYVPPALTGVGHFPGGTDSKALAVSLDGTTIVGEAAYVPPGQSLPHTSAFRLRAGSAMESLGTPYGSTWPGSVASKALAVNADGSVVVGWSHSPSSHTAFRWTTASGFASLPVGVNGEGETMALAVSSNGGCVTGSVGSLFAGPAFRWTPTSTEVFPQLGPTGWGLIGRAVTDDGTVFGQGSDGFGNRAFKRGPSNTYELLNPPATHLYWEPRAVTPDGAVAIGRSYSSFTGRFSACKWTPAGAVNLGWAPGDNYAELLTLSADGQTAAGWGRFEGEPSRQQHAVIWTAEGGMRDLKEYLQSLGTDVAGWNLYIGAGVSGDGRMIVGVGVHNGQHEGFVVRFPRSVADVGGQGGVSLPDHRLDNNDFVAFVDLFFSRDVRADVGEQGGVPGHDGEFDNNDFIAFIDAFFTGFAF